MSTSDGPDGARHTDPDRALADSVSIGSTGPAGAVDVGPDYVAPEQPSTDDAGGPELRRWRLVARLAELRYAAITSRETFARAVSDVLAGELGDLAAVVLVDPDDVEVPIAALTHHNPARAPLVDWLRSVTTPSRIRQLVAYMGVDHTVVTGVPPASERGTYQVYDREVGIDATAYAPVRRGDVLLGGISCTRDRGSGRFSASDLSALAAAADMISLVLDATAARRAIGEVEKRQVAAFDAAPIGMSNLDLAGTITAINHAGCFILGRPSTEIVGRSWREFAHPEDVASDEEFMSLAATGGIEPERSSTRRVRRRDGSTRWIHVTSQFIRDGAGTPIGFHTQFADVTSQFEAEAEADRLATLVHSSPDFVAIATLEGQIAFVNAAGRALVGLSESFDVTAATVQDFVITDGVGVGLDEFDSVVRDRTWEGVSTLRDWRDGSSIPVLATSYVIEDLHTGLPTAIATVRRDIREQLADQVELARRAEERRRLLAELVSAEQNERRRVAEDLHDESVQLLAAGQLRLQLLTRQLQTGQIEAASTSTRDVTDLVISALQRLREVLVDLEPPTGPGHAVEDSLRDAAQRLFSGTEVAVRIDGGLDDPTPEAAAVLYRAAREALSNARRHAAASNVDVLLVEAPDQWRVTVEDDGVGIAADIVPRRGHLGLTGMVSRIEALGGTVTFGRRPEGGTRVELMVPRSSDR